MMPSSSDLQYFLAVAETRNISRAAERLGITQPSLSLSIQRLERCVGVSLLLRGKTGVQLTRTGQKLRGQAQSMLAEWERITIEAQKDETTIRGTFSIGCHPSVALYGLPHFLPKLMAQHPGIELRLDHDLSRRITESVISYKTDFGIVINPVSHPDLVVKKLAHDQVSLWTATKPSGFQNPLNGDGVLIFEPDLHQSQRLLREFSKARWTFKRHVTTSNLEVIASLVAEGVGAGILPSLVARRQKTLGLRPWSATGPKVRDQIALIYRADAQKSLAGRTIAKAIETEIAAIAEAT